MESEKSKETFPFFVMGFAKTLAKADLQQNTKYSQESAQCWKNNNRMLGFE